jgi:hypothetical protein
MVGVLFPFMILAAVQVAMSLRRPSAEAARSSRATWVATLMVAAVFGLVWAFRIPEPRTALFVIFWLPAVAFLTLYRRLGAAESALSGVGPLALLTLLFAGELPIHPFLPVVNWGDTTSMKYLFPTHEPYFGRGGRLVPGLRARMRSAEYPGGAVLVTNADGFRNAETVTPQPAPGEYRILSLGDSQACGYGATQEAFFGALLEKRLRSVTSRRDVKVLSTEVSDPAYGLYYLQRYGLSFAPDIVIYGLSGNDVMQCAQFAGPNRRFRFREDGLLEPNPTYPYRDRQPPADADSLVSELQDWVYPAACRPASLQTLRRGPQSDTGPALSSALRTFRLLWTLWPFDSGPPVVMPSFAVNFETTDGHKRLIDGYANLGHYYLRDPERTKNVNAAVKPVLRGFKRACQTAGARFILVLFPQRFQVAPADWEVMRTFWNLDSGDFDFSLLNREPTAFAASEDIEILDLLDTFRDGSRTHSLYLPGGDMHFNRHGHELAATVTAHVVQSRGR